MNNKLTHQSQLCCIHRHCPGRFLLVFALGLAGSFTAWAASPPVVSNVTATQRPGTKLVDIRYDLADPDSTAISISIRVSKDGGATFDVPANTFTGAYGAGISPGTGKAIVWNAGADWDGQYTTTCRVRVLANDADPVGFVLIPDDDSFQMGDPLDGNADAPVHTVSLSGFYMEKSLVTGERWNAVYQWALLHGYSFDNPGLSKAVNHPAHTVNWYDAVKWCNARSQMEGRTPIYYTDALRRNVYKAGQTTPYLGVLDPLGQQYGGANGYRLPTEAEWEKAARGGLVGKRFPWGDTITHSQANYASSADIPYDTSPTRGYHPSYAIGDFPYTSPVASFAPNGYGLNDMAGNLEQWCWDWYGDAYYSASNGALDPLGPASGVLRVRRGFSWTSIAERLRCAKRDGNPPGGGSHFTGFRCVRGL